MNDKPGRLKVWTPLLFALILIFGMVLGFNLRDTLRNKRDIQTLERNDRLEQIIDLVNAKYVDSLNPTLLYDDAINGILSRLDPHTVYIPADEFDERAEELEGGFFGIGVEFSIIRDTIQVTSVIENGPAAKAGVDITDQLIKVGDSIVAGKSITSDRIIKMLKGKQHSKVFVTMREPQSGRLKIVSIKRDLIPVHSVDAQLMLDDITAYIKIDRFSATTYNEFTEAIQQLKGQGMKQLVIDLRQNPGGYLEAATNIADELLDGEKLLVYTQGKSSPKHEYKAKKEGLFENGRLAILVDESSASASEIIAGAIQDWDRGVIIGRRTYGKGLVQEQYDMDNGAALRLTIAKYYTPSGRSIQRSFEKGRNEYDAAFVHRFETGELTGYDTTEVADTAKYYTSNKRVVYGGGGIKPDIYVPYDTARLSSRLLNFVFSDDMKNVVWDYFMKNRSSLMEYKSFQKFSSEFKTDDLANNYINRFSPPMKRAALILMRNKANYNYLKLQMKAQLARILFRDNGYYAISVQDDNMVQKAISIMRDPAAYSEIIKR